MKIRCFLLLATCSFFFLSLTQPAFSSQVSDTTSVIATVTPGLGDQKTTWIDVTMYTLAFLLVVYEWLARTIPTINSYSFLTWIYRLIQFIVPDRYKNAGPSQKLSVKERWRAVIRKG